MLEEISFVSAGRFTSRETRLHPARLLDTDEVICVVKVPSISLWRTIRTDSSTATCCCSNRAGITAVRWKAVLAFRFTGCIFTVPLGCSCRSVGWYALTRRSSSCCGGSFCMSPPAAIPDYLSRLILIELCRPAATACPTTLQIAEWVRINCGRPLTVSDVAEHFGYNPDYLPRLYRRGDSRGLKACIDEARLQNVKRLLLTTDLPLNEVARHCGFGDYKYFLKYFVYHEEMTPTQFRTAFFRQHTNNR